MSPHPCSFLLYDGDIEEEIGLVKIGDVYCALKEHRSFFAVI